MTSSFSIGITSVPYHSESQMTYLISVDTAARLSLSFRWQTRLPVTLSHSVPVRVSHDILIYFHRYYDTLYYSVWNGTLNSILLHATAFRNLNGTSEPAVRCDVFTKSSGWSIILMKMVSLEIMILLFICLHCVVCWFWKGILSSEREHRLNIYHCLSEMTLGEASS